MENEEKSMAYYVRCFCKSFYALNGNILIIAGDDGFPLAFDKDANMIGYMINDEYYIMMHACFGVFLFDTHNMKNAYHIVGSRMGFHCFDWKFDRESGEYGSVHGSQYCASPEIQDLISLAIGNDRQWI